MKSMINIPNGKKEEEVLAPVRHAITETINENTRIAICETGLRRLRKSYNVAVFILTNLIFPVESFVFCMQIRNIRKWILLLNFVNSDFPDSFSQEFVIQAFNLDFLDCP